MVTDPVQPLRCTYCRRQFGWARQAANIRNQTFCTDWCVKESAAYGGDHFRERNDTWRMLAALGMSPVKIAKLWGVNHSNVYDTVRKGGSIRGRARSRGEVGPTYGQESAGAAKAPRADRAGREEADPAAAAC